MRKLLLGAALLTSGFACDDPEVQSRASEVLEHGISHAQISCVISAGCVIPGTTYFRATIFQDGSSLVTNPWAQFNERGTSVKTCPVGDTICYEMVDGDIKITGTGCTVRYVDGAENCTGRNLEAFGVEE